MTKQERYIASLEEQVARQRQTIRTLRVELERKKRQASVMSAKTLKLFLTLGYTPEEVLRYYAVSPKKATQFDERKENE